MKYRLFVLQSTVLFQIDLHLAIEKHSHSERKIAIEKTCILLFAYRYSERDITMSNTRKIILLITAGMIGIVLALLSASQAFAETSIRYGWSAQDANGQFVLAGTKYCLGSNSEVCPVKKITNGKTTVNVNSDAVVYLGNTRTGRAQALIIGDAIPGYKDAFITSFAIVADPAFASKPATPVVPSNPITNTTKTTNTNKTTNTATNTNKTTNTTNTTKTSTKSIASASVTIADQAYTGKALTPAPTVKLDGKTLKQGTDYTVSYSNNTKVGEKTAKVTVNGKGSYTGTKSATFSIRYSITYALNGGTLPATAPKTYVAGKEIKLVAPTRSGYIFAGWTGSNGQVLTTSVTLNSKTIGNKTYTANWASPSSMTDKIHTEESNSSTSGGYMIRQLDYRLPNSKIPSGFTGAMAMAYDSHDECFYVIKENHDTNQLILLRYNNCAFGAEIPIKVFSGDEVSKLGHVNEMTVVRDSATHDVSLYIAPCAKHIARIKLKEDGSYVGLEKYDTGIPYEISGISYIPENASTGRFALKYRPFADKTSIIFTKVIKNSDLPLVIPKQQHVATLHIQHPKEYSNWEWVGQGVYVSKTDVFFPLWDQNGAQTDSRVLHYKISSNGKSGNQWMPTKANYVVTYRDDVSEREGSSGKCFEIESLELLDGKKLCFFTNEHGGGQWDCYGQDIYDSIRFWDIS